MNKYTELSDFEINCHILETFEPNIIHMSLSRDEKSFFHCGHDGNGFYEITIPDYCNNPSDAMPIIIENEISVTLSDDNDEGKWMAFDGYWCDEYSLSRTLVSYGDNYYRIAMEVYLLMKDAENENNNNS
ncbi:phage protein NinX family protein [Providencia rettgeri]|uniref:phage protein NinX family protein n=1 Tax=Providencia TaxID=586 RepID=UPI001373C6D7|nr:phage protein NinX family protein [Providencia rettgeri]BBU96552.1 hypothetical protein BML2496_24350 [Providencia rettgeri]